MKISVPFKVRSEVPDEADKVPCDRDGEYESHGNPERTVQIRIGSDLVVEVVLIECWDHGAGKLAQHFGCVHIKVLLVVFDLPDGMLGHLVRFSI